MAASPAVLRSRVLARAVTSSRSRSLLGAHANPPPSLLATSPRPSAVHRLPSACGGLLSVMPLHSAVVGTAPVRDRARVPELGRRSSRKFNAFMTA